LSPDFKIEGLDRRHEDALLAVAPLVESEGQGRVAVTDAGEAEGFKAAAARVGEGPFEGFDHGLLVICHQKDISS
jgi:hypothetical protein